MGAGVIASHDPCILRGEHISRNDASDWKIETLAPRIVAFAAR